METSLPSGAPLRPILPDLDTVEDGMIFKQCVRDRVVDRMASNQQILASDEETEVQEMLAGFSSKERKRILRWGEDPPRGTMTRGVPSHSELHVTSCNSSMLHRCATTWPLWNRYLYFKEKQQLAMTAPLI